MERGCNDAHPGKLAAEQTRALRKTIIHGMNYIYYLRAPLVACWVCLIFIAVYAQDGLGWLRVQSQRLTRRSVAT